MHLKIARKTLIDPLSSAKIVYEDLLTVGSFMLAEGIINIHVLGIQNSPLYNTETSYC